MTISFFDDYIALVRDNRDFRNLWFSQMISLLGDWFNLIASAALVADLSGSGLAIGGACRSWHAADAPAGVAATSRPASIVAPARIQESGASSRRRDDIAGVST